MKAILKKDQQLEIIHSFLTELFPPQNSKRKYVSNELAGIAKRINVVINEIFGFKLSTPEFQLILDRTYKRMEVEMTDASYRNSEYKFGDRQLQAKPGTPIFYTANKDIDGTFHQPRLNYYYNIPPRQVDELFKSFNTMPPNTSRTKVEYYFELKENAYKVANQLINRL